MIARDADATVVDRGSCAVAGASASVTAVVSNSTRLTALFTVVIVVTLQMYAEMIANVMIIASCRWQFSDVPRRKRHDATV